MSQSDLLVDIGNTFVKWRLAGDDDSRDGGVLIDDFKITDLPDVDSFLVSKVGHCGIFDELENIHYVKTSKHFLGLECGYKNHTELGIDRWMAMLGAADLYADFLLIDAGSALTFDLVVKKQHIGGLIMPGLQAINHSFEVIKPSISLPQFSDNMGVCTDEAWGFGVSAMFLNSIISRVKQTLAKYPSVHIILTGGDSKIIINRLDDKVLWHKNLVLDGLAVVRKHR